MSSTVTGDLPQATSVVGGAPTSPSSEPWGQANPARPDEVVGWVTPGDARTVELAVATASSAFASWRSMPSVERGRLLARLAASVDARAEELARLVTAEEGKTLDEARGEVVQAVATLDFHAHTVLRPEGAVLPSPVPDQTILTRRVPVGVVAAITPWNFPLVIPAWKLAPALAAGNTVVWKPAAPVSLTSWRLAELIAEAGFPPGVCNLVLGGADVGSVLVSHPAVAAVTFTGSEVVGARVAAAAGARRARCQLELGGLSAAIVHADADLELAASALVTGFTSGSGQKCTATRRILVSDTVAEQLEEMLAERVRSLVVGDGADPATQVGPLVSGGAQAAVTREVEAALVAGAAVVARYELTPAPGFFVAPIILATGDKSLAVCQEEVFGPVATLSRFDRPEDAIAEANSSRYGLTAAVFTRSLRLAQVTSSSLEAGVVKVNAPTTGSELHAPFGGTKASSAFGYREQGWSARNFFSEVRTTYVNWPS